MSIAVTGFSSINSISAALAFSLDIAYLTRAKCIAHCLPQIRVCWNPYRTPEKRAVIYDSMVEIETWRPPKLKLQNPVGPASGLSTERRLGGRACRIGSRQDREYFVVWRSLHTDRR